LAGLSTVTSLITNKPNQYGNDDQYETLVLGIFYCTYLVDTGQVKINFYAALKSRNGSFKDILFIGGRNKGSSVTKAQKGSAQYVSNEI
jgi:hypothetical protein